MGNVVSIKRAPVSKRTRMETLLITPESVSTWRTPPFQRPVRINEKVRSLVEEIKQNGGVLPGILTLGVIESGRDAGTYKADGQHRLEAFLMSGLEEGLADVRIVVHDSMAEMGAEFVRDNSHLVNMRPDDVLRGLEASVEVLSTLREKCQFIGYGNIRRGDSSPVLSMSSTLRVWHGSAAEAPITNAISAAQLCQDMQIESANQLAEFLLMAYAAWGRGVDVQRLWGNLNLIMCMWLWRRLVLDTDRRGNKRAIVMKMEQFKKCLMSLAASAEYGDWLVGRAVTDRDRSPCYQRMKGIFLARLREEGIETAKFPSPAWAKQ